MYYSELTSTQRDLQRRARALADSELGPRARQWDETSAFPETSYTALGREGLLGLTVPASYGGTGQGVLEACLVLEEVARGCLASAMALQMNVNGPSRVISTLGTEEQRRWLLPGAADGSRYFAVAMTEPDAGSDGLGLTTRLERRDGRWFLTGTKCYITGGVRADTFLVFCRLAGTSGARGIGAVIVESSAAGFHCAVTEQTMGGRGVPEATLTFEDVEITDVQIVVPPDAETKNGAAILIQQFNPERCGNAAMSIGVARAAFEEALRHCKSREQFGRRLIEFQGLQWKLADMAVDLEASERLLRTACRSSDEHGFPELLPTAMAKLHANEMVQRVTNTAIQLLGHKGYSTDSPVERYFRDGRGLGLAGGTTEVLRNLIAAGVAGERFSQRA